MAASIHAFHLWGELRAAAQPLVVFLMLKLSGESQQGGFFIVTALPRIHTSRELDISGREDVRQKNTGRQVLLGQTN